MKKMCDNAKQYSLELKRNLRCGKSYRRKMLNQFNKAMDDYLQDNGMPSMNDLHSAFGSPKEMAEILMEGMPSEEKEKNRKYEKYKKTLCGILIIAIAAFTLYVLLIKEFKLSVVVETDPGVPVAVTETSNHIVEDTK